MCTVHQKEPEFDLLKTTLADLQEAGGKVTDMAGKPMRLKAGPIVASCGGQLHDRVLSLLREAECTGEEVDLR
jgi:hypothetical protein